MKYQSELIKEIIDMRGHDKSSLHYESECIETWIEENKGAYPKLTDYQAEWLNYITQNPIGEFPYESITDVTNATIDNVVPLAYKSAILKGNTKEITGKNIYTGIDEDGYISLSSGFQTATGAKTTEWLPCEPNTTYVCNSPSRNRWMLKSSTGVETVVGGNTGNETPTVTTLSDTAYLRCYYKHDGYNDEITLQIEKGDISTDYEPYWKKLESVKMPVLTTTGKNLLKTKTTTFNFEGNKQVSKLVGYVKVEKNKRYTVSFSFQKNIDVNNSSGVEIVGCNDIPEESLNYWYASNDSRCKLFNKNSSITEKSTINNFKYTIPSDHDVNYIAIYCGSYYKEYVGIVENVQIETGTTATSYEPYKSNSLTTPSDLVMRSNGDICDTLDLITGQFTQRIDENGEVLAQEIIKTVDLTITNQDGKTLNELKPIEGTMHLSTSGENIRPLFSCEIPVEAITQNLASFIDLEMEE